MLSTWLPEPWGKDSGTHPVANRGSSSQQQPAPEALVQSFPDPFPLHGIFSLSVHSQQFLINSILPALSHSPEMHPAPGLSLACTSCSKRSQLFQPPPQLPVLQAGWLFSLAPLAACFSQRAAGPWQEGTTRSLYNELGLRLNQKIRTHIIREHSQAGSEGSGLSSNNRLRVEGWGPGEALCGH